MRDLLLQLCLDKVEADKSAEAKKQAEDLLLQESQEQKEEDAASEHSEDDEEQQQQPTGIDMYYRLLPSGELGLTERHRVTVHDHEGKAQVCGMRFYAHRTCNDTAELPDNDTHGLRMLSCALCPCVLGPVPNGH